MDIPNLLDTSPLDKYGYTPLCHDPSLMIFPVEVDVLGGPVTDSGPVVRSLSSTRDPSPPGSDRGDRRMDRFGRRRFWTSVMKLEGALFSDLHQVEK